MKITLVFKQQQINIVLSMFLSVFLFVNGTIIAQTLPYFQGFEDPVENANWNFVNASGFSNPWAIGTATARMGTHSMYISYNNGTNAAYTTSKGSSVAYRTFTLPGSAQYEVDFDWKCLGNGTDKLYVCWVTNASENVNAWATTNNATPTGVILYCKTWTARNGSSTNPLTFKDTVMTGYASWQHGSFIVTGSGAPAKLVFFWTNSQAAGNNPGGCIDNVQINRKQTCPKPTNLNFTLSTQSPSDGFLTWGGNATSWDVMYKNDNDPNWITHSGLTTKTDTISNLTKGVYTFWVRAHCGPDSSSWAVLTNVLVYTTMANCIDYIDLDAPNVTCYIGTNTGQPNNNTFRAVPKVDYGSSSNKSRHTVHYGIGEYDFQTNNGLPTVPPGEVAAVRLGNWSTGAEAEAIAYDFVVDSLASVFVLKYAVVLQDPGHSPAEMPRFTLQILDSLDHLIDPTCGQADFVAGSNTQGWHVIMRSSYDKILWKDWTTVGLNLSNYVGQRLKARLTTYDCSQSGHYGYAYFTLDCAKATLEGETCGGATTSTITAPPGFVYQWYPETDPTNVVSTERTFTATQADTATYICKVSFAEEPQCFFTLRLELTPKWPVSAAGYTLMPENCRNVVQLDNKSFVGSNQGVRPDEVPSSYKWHLSDGRESTSVSPKFVFPNKGGTYGVTLVSGMAGDQCQDTLNMMITVPPLHSYDSLLQKNICEGGSYAFNNKVYTKTGVYSDTLKTFAGCDSILTLNLHVYSEFTEIKYDTICDGSVYDFNGTPLTQTGVYVDTLLSVDRCDSIVTLHLQVNPVLSVVFDQLPEICADDPDFIIGFTPSYLPTSYAVRFGNKAKSAGFVDQVSRYIDHNITVPIPQPCPPDNYDATIQFIDSTYMCGDILEPFTFSVLYPDSIIRQKFGNVLALKNDQYNGGFTFRGYQWYRNGSPIIGQTGSYIYLGEGNNLNTSDEYRVMITRADGSTLMSCAFAPQAARPVISVVPRIVGSADQIRITLNGKGVAKLWSTGGILLRTVQVKEQCEVSAPSEPGVYLLQVITEQGDKETFRVVVTGQ